MGFIGFNGSRPRLCGLGQSGTSPEAGSDGKVKGGSPMQTSLCEPSRRVAARRPHVPHRSHPQRAEAGAGRVFRQREWQSATPSHKEQAASAVATGMRSRSRTMVRKMRGAMWRPSTSLGGAWSHAPAPGNARRRRWALPASPAQVQGAQRAQHGLQCLRQLALSGGTGTRK